MCEADNDEEEDDDDDDDDEWVCEENGTGVGTFSFGTQNAVCMGFLLGPNASGWSETVLDISCLIHKFHTSRGAPPCLRSPAYLKESLLWGLSDEESYK